MTIHIGWPQAIYFILLLAGTVQATLEHGKPRKPRNAWHALWAELMILGLMIWGGFFS